MKVFVLWVVGFGFAGFVRVWNSWNSSGIRVNSFNFFTFSVSGEFRWNSILTLIRGIRQGFTVVGDRIPQPSLYFCSNRVLASDWSP